MNIIKYRYLFFFISGTFIIASIFAVLAYGLKPGIDFSGGTLWQIKLSGTDAGNLSNFFESDLNVKNAVVYPQEADQNLSQDYSQNFLVR